LKEGPSGSFFIHLTIYFKIMRAKTGCLLKFACPKLIAFSTLYLALFFYGATKLCKQKQINGRLVIALINPN